MKRGDVGPVTTSLALVSLYLCIRHLVLGAEISIMLLTDLKDAYICYNGARSDRVRRICRAS